MTKPKKKIPTWVLVASCGIFGVLALVLVALFTLILVGIRGME